ncbi:ATP-binding protein [uncultured Tateyamaria sp.]|uniref:sensor histidine kinase n=1 Tax=uncultured Tateyamaria sp. TaxID=455651 RepID=UPI0026065EB1|nr:HAMP domain-containing sensor histidine kinase [uncultured Tateyamaria sp.]
MNMMSAPRLVRNAYSQDVDRVLALLPKTADVDTDTLSAAFLASPYASFLLDQDARVLVCNRRAERMYIPTSPNLTETGRGMSMHELTRLTREELADALRRGAARSSVELPMLTANRTSAVRPTVFRVALLRSPDRGERLYLLTQDHLKAAAEALGQMNQRRIETREELANFEARFVDLHASLMAMESFAQQASHDLRTPLSTLSGLLQLFDSKFGTEVPDKAREYLAVMSRAVVQMDALTNDFLEHARSVTSEVSAEPLDLRQVIKDVRRDLQNGLTESDLTLLIEGPSCTLMAEPTLLRMMLMNLLSNALKYQHPDRTLRITVSLDAVGDCETILRIADNGRGFDPKEADNIFLPFRRYHTSIDGTGIGLSTCSEVCRRHGWDISAQSDGSSGATFSIRFPQTQQSLQSR